MAHNYRNDVAIDWCPGCGDFGIVSALTQALGELNLDPNDVIAVSGIGCSGKTPHYLNIAGVHTLHGRAIPYATGVKLANPNLNVLVTGGDGDLMSIGAGHFVAEGRRNTGLTVILYDNAVYGLTKGQAAPTLALGEQTKSLPRPNMFSKVNPIALALTSGYTFVARGFTSDIKQLKEIIKKGMQHEGSALIDVLQPCPTYNNINTMDWYRNRVYKLEDEDSWDPIVTEDNVSSLQEKFTKAYNKGLEWDEKIPTGVFFDNRTVPPFTKRLEKNLPEYFSNPPSSQVIASPDGKTLVDPVETFRDRVIQ
ncbi:2-oxoacid:ferredoxin oxidoreductase subunit beta [uncultured archaeon]|nr:2-oxoacid:ferredoxin oxidoreductase subunit beta [uncultured archaeon]HKJ96152.1 2-oxoacid:ferredoxin oxidoreductase subunit beta [Thermoplasmataceae archaeon]